MGLDMYLSKKIYIWANFEFTGVEGVINITSQGKPVNINLHKVEYITEEELAYSCPMGIELTARITTNYLQLKTMYHQRKNHKLPEWHDFCEWVESLPYAEEFITGEVK